MIEFYPQIKSVHVGAASASGALFLLRGLALHLGARWAMVAPLRYLSYAIDTVLLTAALMLATILHQYPFVHGWLTAKVVLLVVYIVLGTYDAQARRDAHRARKVLARRARGFRIDHQHRPRASSARAVRAAVTLSAIRPEMGHRTAAAGEGPHRPLRRPSQACG